MPTDPQDPQPDDPDYDPEVEAAGDAIDKALDDVGEIYALISQGMLREMNQSVESRLCTVLFLMGATMAAGVRHGLSPRLTAGCFAAVMGHVGQPPAQANSIADFGLEVW